MVCVSKDCEERRCSPRAPTPTAGSPAPLQFLYIPSIFGAQHAFDVTVGLLGVYLTFGTFLPWCIAAGVAMIRSQPATSIATATRAPDLTAATLRA
jgi:hypothetical protein